MQSLIEQTLKQNLSPLHLEVENESHMHSVAPGSQTHFRVVIVSEQFEGCPPVARHRKVNALLKPAFEQGLHALALHTLTPQQWFERGGEAPQSPPCMGGSKTVQE